MNKLIIISIIAGLAVFVWLNKPTNTQNISPGKNVSISPIPSGNKNLITHNSAEYGYSIVRNILPSKIKLVYNYEYQRGTQEIINDNKCLAGINGGFYSESNRPLGLVVIDGKDFSNEKSSSLLNGFAGINASGEAKIGYQRPDDLIHGVQTGPVILNNSKPAVLSMARDALARRMILGRDENGNIALVAVYDSISEKLGPRLTDLPEIMKQIGIKENLKLVDAINLDGGGASAFFSPEKLVKESDSVGSWWCVYE